jgi:uncharacterized FlgJ-related protein
MRKTLMIILIGGTIVTSSSIIKSSQSIKKRKVSKVVKLLEKRDSVDSTVLTKELLVNVIMDSKIPHPEIAYSIACLESNLCSNLAKENKNLFGMRHPGVRPTLSKGSKNGFASFTKWQDSVRDYKLYLEYAGGQSMSKEEYLAFLDRNYCQPGYSSHLSKFFDEFHTIKKN